MRTFARHLRHNAIAYVALVLAMGGTSYAATTLPANSIGTRQLQNGAVTGQKVRAHSLLAQDFKLGQLSSGVKGNTGAAGLQGPKGDSGTAGAQGPKGDTGATGPQGPQGPTGPAGPSGSAPAGTITGYQVITADGDIATDPGATSQYELFARCPAGTRLPGGGATSSTDEPILTNSGPYQDSTQRYEIWDARWLVRSDVSSGDTIHVRAYAFCANVGF
jgi:Collagen triple helix repeat (20 copies)